MRHLLNNNTWTNSLLKISTNQLIGSCTPDEDKISCIRAGRKIHGTHLPHTHIPWLGVAQSGEKGFLASPWGGKEKTEIYFGRGRLPKGLISVLPHSEHWWNWYSLDALGPLRTNEWGGSLLQPVQLANQWGKDSLQSIVLGKLNIHKQKNELGPLPYTVHNSILKMD